MQIVSSNVLELKETMARVGADLKQRVVDSMKSTWNSLYQLALFNKQSTSSTENLTEVHDVFKDEMEKNNEEQDEINLETQTTDLPLGILNKGRRVDYVLQEAPFEFFNEYIFALTSHVCYWYVLLLILSNEYMLWHNFFQYRVHPKVLQHILYALT